MSFLRLGALCIVVDGEGRVLLSRREDLKTWTLPGGRLDKNEFLETCALREVREETGLEAEIIRPAGLLFLLPWRRLNVVYLARATGRRLFRATDETLDNRFFAPADLPVLHHRAVILDALADQTLLRIDVTPPGEYRQLRRQFALRYVRNLLRGRPEPRYPRFSVFATASAHPGAPVTVRCDGRRAPWEQLQTALQQITTADVERISWAGVQQDLKRNTIEFLFDVTRTR